MDAQTPTSTAKAASRHRRVDQHPRRLCAGRRGRGLGARSRIRPRPPGEDRKPAGGRPRRLWRGARLRLDRIEQRRHQRRQQHRGAQRPLRRRNPLGGDLADRRRQQCGRGHRHQQRPAIAGAGLDHQHDDAGQRHRLRRDQIRRARLHYRALRQRLRCFAQRRHQRYRRQLRRRLEQCHQPDRRHRRSPQRMSITATRRTAPAAAQHGEPPMADHPPTPR